MRASNFHHQHLTPATQRGTLGHAKQTRTERKTPTRLSLPPDILRASSFLWIIRSLWRGTAVLSNAEKGGRESQMERFLSEPTGNERLRDRSSLREHAPPSGDVGQTKFRQTRKWFTITPARLSILLTNQQEVEERKKKIYICEIWKKIMDWSEMKQTFLDKHILLWHLGHVHVRRCTEVTEALKWERKANNEY